MPQTEALKRMGVCVCMYVCNNIQIAKIHYDRKYYFNCQSVSETKKRRKREPAASNTALRRESLENAQLHLHLHTLQVRALQQRERARENYVKLSVCV